MSDNDWRYMMQREVVKLRNRAITFLLIFTVLAGLLDGIYS